MIIITTLRIERLDGMWKFVVDYDKNTTPIVVEFGTYEPRKFLINSDDLNEYGFTSADAKKLFNNSEAKVRENNKTKEKVKR